MSQEEHSNPCQLPSTITSASRNMLKNKCLRENNKNWENWSNMEVLVIKFFDVNKFSYRKTKIGHFIGAASKFWQRFVTFTRSIRKISSCLIRPLVLGEILKTAGQPTGSESSKNWKKNIALCFTFMILLLDCFYVKKIVLSYLINFSSFV